MVNAAVVVAVLRLDNKDNFANVFSEEQIKYQKKPAKDGYPELPKFRHVSSRVLGWCVGVCCSLLAV
jgi:hypothetical protein